MKNIFYCHSWNAINGSLAYTFYFSNSYISLDRKENCKRHFFVSHITNACIQRQQQQSLSSSLLCTMFCLHFELVQRFNIFWLNIQSFYVSLSASLPYAIAELIRNLYENVYLHTNICFFRICLEHQQYFFPIL